jgi:hypothetical protein
MKTKILYWVAIVLIIEIGLLHMMMAQAEYEEAAYMGYLFAANFLGALLAAFGMYHKQGWGWLLGSMIVVGSIAGYAWSRTLGMPGMEVEEWFTPYGIVAMSAEGVFVLIALLRPWKRPVGELLPASRLKYALPVVVLAVIVSIGALAYRWDAAVGPEFGYHVGSLDEVLDTPAEPMTEMEEKYGVKVSLAAMSMMNSIVDVRIQIVDPDKAHSLLQNQAAILVDQQALILAPHMHSHSTTRLKAGKNFILFFPSEQIIASGSQVSVVFGSVRMEPVVVR